MAKAAESDPRKLQEGPSNSDIWETDQGNERRRMNLLGIPLLTRCLNYMGCGSSGTRLLLGRIDG